MSQWVDEPGSQRSESAPAASPADAPGPVSAPASGKVRIWIRALPFFFSAFLFLSGFFAIFSPLPLILMFLGTRRGWAWLAVGTNAALVWYGTGPTTFQFYLVFVGTISLSLPEFLRRKVSLERTVVLTLLTVLLVIGLFVAAYAQLHHVNPFSEMKNLVNGFVDTMIQTLSPEAREQWLGSSEIPDIVEWKHKMLVEIPSAMGILALAMIWINLTLVLRLNPKHIREVLGVDARYLQNWKCPDYLVWPTILAGFLTLASLGWPTDVALNVFKFLMAIYAIQGLAILAFLFDVWNIRGFFRTLGFVVALFLMLPLLLSIGFFDQWFDFRAKFRQS